MNQGPYDASHRMYNMAGEANNKYVGYALTGLSVALMAAFVIKELKGVFKDEFAEWQKHHERYEGKQYNRHETHSERVRRPEHHEQER